MTGKLTGDNNGRYQTHPYCVINAYRPTSHHFCVSNDFCTGVLDNGHADMGKNGHDRFLCRECLSTMCIS